MKSNIHKKLTSEDKFARKFYRQHARLNQLRFEKRNNKRKFRRLVKQELSLAINKEMK